MFEVKSNLILKKLLLLSALFIFACSSDDSSEDSPLPTYTIEGKWLIEGTVPAGTQCIFLKMGCVILTIV
jgi:hypothetical protein